MGLGLGLGMGLGLEGQGVHVARELGVILSGELRVDALQVGGGRPNRLGGSPPLGEIPLGTSLSAWGVAWGRRGLRSAFTLCQPAADGR